MNYIQYMKPGGTTENKKETSKFIELLNKAGKFWKDFWDKPVTVQYAYNPHAVVGNGGTPFSTTQRRGDFATQTAAAIAIPATAAGVATVGVVPTLVGMGAGMGAGIAADVGGSKLVELAGGDENAQEMVGDIAGFTFGALAGGKATKVSTNYLNLWNSQLSPKSIYTSMAEGLAPTTTQNYGLVKYYGPTMGKTTAARTNPKLVDFDDIVRGPIAELAAKKGVTPRDLKIANDPDYISLLEAEVARWRMNPANAGKTLVISNKALSSSTAGYNNQPSIPEKETFIARQVQRGGNREEAAAYYDALIENNPNLKIDNRFVSDIESGTRAAKISAAERLGIPKGDRGNLSASQQEAVRDLHHYITDGKFKQRFLFDAETNQFFWGNAKPTPSTNAITTIAQHPQATIRLGDDGIGYMRIPTQYGTLTYFPHLKTTSHTISFPKSKINPQGFGEAAARAENQFGKSVILTSPKTDATDAGVVVEGLSSTVPKRQVYDFYKQLALTSKPGTYVTGDAAAYPLGHQAIVDYVGGNSTKAVATILSGETPTVTAASRTGLSPDSYISLLRSAQRPEWKLSFNRKAGFGKWNNSAVNNSDIYNAWQAARNGTLEQKQAYIQLFNDWVAPYGGAKAYINDKGIIIHPHPFIVRQKSGGAIHIKKKNRGKFTASAKAAGEGVQEHAHKVMNDPNATPLQRKRANFAIQAKKWHRKHQLGSKINYLNIF